MSTPDLLPARMLNEYAYCPRLFHLEWVGAQFADNDDTEEGRAVHRRVDTESWTDGAGGDEPPKVARSVLVSSESLGLVARIDLVESQGTGAVVPVDYKRGWPAPTPEGAWEPERVQLCAQGLLLREGGYRCDHGELWFAGARRRVVVPFDEPLIERTKNLAIAARHAAESPVPPPPLIDSPKCPRCSLVGLCLPDEVNFLAKRRVDPPRRLVPRDHAGRPMYVHEQGARVGVDHGRIVVTKSDQKLASVRLADVTQVNVFGNVQISTQAMSTFFRRDITVGFFSYGSWFRGVAHGMSSGNVELRTRQVGLAARGDVDTARRMVAGKIANARTLLRRNSREDVTEEVGQLGRLQAQAGSADTLSTLLGIEGTAARICFGRFPSMLRDVHRLPGGPFTFEGRKRRPPPDPINALLSYCYALLTKDLHAATFLVGLDPYVGLFHRPRFGRPALALDLMEEFRPLVADSVVLQVVNNGEISAGDFVHRSGIGVSLTPTGRKAVLRAYERRLDHELTHPWFKYKATYRRLFEVQTRVLAAYLMGEVPHYAPLTTR